MWWGRVCIDLSNPPPPSFVVLGSMVVQNTTFVLILYYRSVSERFSMVDCSPCLLMYTTRRDNAYQDKGSSQGVGMHVDVEVSSTRRK